METGSAGWRKNRSGWMNLPGEKKEEEGYVTIDGQEHISDKIHNLTANVEERVYCSCSGVCLNS